MRVPQLLVVLIVGLIGCANPNGPTDVGDAQEELARNRRQFQASVGGSYRVTLENNCFCPLEILQPVRLTVQNGAITEVTRLSDGTAIPSGDWRAYRTVEQVFAEIDSGLTNAARRVTVDYDERLGYPVDVLIDHNMAADAFVGYKLRDLERR